MDTLNTKRIIKIIILTAASMTAIIIFRLAVDQLQGYTAAVKYLNSGDKKNAIMHFDRVLNAHIPFSPAEKKSKEYLIALAAEFEEANEPELALLCYETVRTSGYLTRHFLLPHSRDVSFLNSRIAAIKAAILLKDGVTNDFKTAEARQINVLQRDFSPSAGWSLTAVAAFWAYIGCIIIWILSRKRIYGMVVCASLILWILALYNA